MRVIYFLLISYILLSLVSCNEADQDFMSDENSIMHDSNELTSSTKTDENMSQEEIDYENFQLPELDVPYQTILLENFSVYDSINNRFWNYNVLLPESYEVNVFRTYPVLFLLHGLGAHNEAWGLNIYGAKECLDYYLYHRLLEDLIVVMPDADETYYVNNYQDNIKYEDFFISTFIPHIQSIFRVKTEKENIFIAGNSMGGYGASYYAFKYPHLFGYCFSISGALDGKDSDVVIPIRMVVENNLNLKNDFPEYYTFCGLEDQFYLTNSEFYKWCDENKINNLFYSWHGVHNFKFFKESIFIVYKIIGNILSRRYRNRGSFNSYMNENSKFN